MKRRHDPCDIAGGAGAARVTVAVCGHRVTGTLLRLCPEGRAEVFSSGCFFAGPVVSGDGAPEE